jgi:hypothetical protein
MPPTPTEPESPKPTDEPVPGQRFGDVASGGSGLHPRGATDGVDVDVRHRSEVDDDAAIRRAVADDAVTTAANGELVPAVARRRDHALNVGDIRDPDDRGRPFVDATVEDGARLVVPRIPGRDEASVEPVVERGDRGMD